MWTALAVVVLGVIIIWRFEAQIKAILDGLANISNKAQKLKYKGLDIDLGSSHPIGLQEQNNDKKIDLQKTYQSPFVTNEEKIIREQLIKEGLTTDQAINVLIYHLANTNLIITMLAIDRLIFKEQIEILLSLNERITAVPQSDLFVFYKKWRESVPETDYEFSSFLNYLLQSGLIMQDINGYTISVLGKEFLSFLVRIGRELPSTK